MIQEEEGGIGKYPFRDAGEPAATPAAKPIWDNLLRLCPDDYLAEVLGA